jgi:glycerol kinase
MAGNTKFCQLLADFLELDIRVPVSTESTAIGAAISAGIGIGIFSAEKTLEKRPDQLTIYSPRKGIFNTSDHQKWKEFLRVLMQAYN